MCRYVCVGFLEVTLYMLCSVVLLPIPVDSVLVLSGIDEISSIVLCYSYAVFLYLFGFFFFFFVLDCALL